MIVTLSVQNHQKIVPPSINNSYGWDVTEMLLVSFSDIVPKPQTERGLWC